jgi:hypothetical protein
VAALAVLLLVAIQIAVSSPSALAASPANDDFANAEPLGSSLLVEVTRSNVEATRETGEYLPGLSPAGHSVWFRWEAPSTRYVTVGSCEAGFSTMVDVFTETALNSLTQVGGGNASEGPHCPYMGREVTFGANGGTTYWIAVDGNSFYAPLEAPPVTEGEFTLRLNATPPPPNDDFANATSLSGSIDEEPDGARPYYASAQGYNWEATTEAGEPFYGANSGASVWYSWTPPESGVYHFNGPCCGGGLNWGLFRGASLGDLSEMLVATGSATVTLSGGGDYRIAVWGTTDLTTEESSMAGFNFQIWARLTPRWLSEAEERPPGMPPPVHPEPSGTASPPLPDTHVVEQVRKPPILVFHLRSSEPGSTFRCKLDGRPLSACSSPLRLRHLKSGRHVLRVAAVDSAGREDPTPAVVRFQVRPMRQG